MRETTACLLCTRETISRPFCTSFVLLYSINCSERTRGKRAHETERRVRGRWSA